MKAKHVFTTLGLALVMGIGVGAALAGPKTVSQAKADGTTTVYCKMTYDWWKADSAAIGVHYWGGSSPSTYPGVRGTAVATDVDVWRFEVPSDSTGFMFVRVNGGTGAVSDWGAKTADLSFQDGKNLYTITSSSAVWGNPGVAGSWSSYVEPAPSTFKMSINGAAATTLEKNGETTEYKLHDDQTLTAGDVLTFTKNDVAQTLTVKPDGGFSSNNVQDVAGDLTVIKTAANANIYWDTSSNKLWVSGYGEAVDGDAYLFGSFNGWAGIKTHGATTDDENYTFSGVTLAAGAEFKMVKYNAAGADDDAKKVWINPTSTQSKYPVDFPASDDGSNVSVTNAGTYDIHVNATTGEYFVAPTTGLPTYTAIYNGLVGEPIALTVDEDGLPEAYVNQHSGILTHAAISKPIQFFKNGVEITSNISVTGNASGICGDAGHGFRIHNSYDGMKVYLKQCTDGDYEIWADHYSVSGLSIDSHSLTFDDDFVAGTYYEQYYLASASYTQGQQVGATSMNGGYSLTLVAEDVAGNNLYTEDGKIYVHNDYEGILYAKRGYDGKFYLYLGGYEASFALTVGGVDYPMTKVDTNSYRASDVPLTAGQVISCKREGAAYAVTGEIVGNNNLQDGLTVLADAASADIYLNTSANTVWVGGLGLASPAGYHLLITNDSAHTVKFLVMTQNPDNLSEWRSNAHAFLAGDKIKIAYCDDSHLPIIYNPADGLDPASSDKFSVVSEVVTCNANVTTNAYIKTSYEHDQLYFGNVSTTVLAAFDWVDGFKTAMQTACSTGDGKQAAVESAWTAQATSYGELDPDVKDIIDQGGYSPYEEIQEFAERYISIKQQHNDWTLNNFMGWEIPTPSNYVMPIIANSNTVIIVALISATILVSAGALFFIIRRKKHQ